MSKIEQSSSLLHKVKNEILEFILYRTSFYGLVNIFKTKYVVTKVFWSLILVGLIGHTIKYILDCVYEYFDYQVITKIEVIGEVISLFPMVTICNLNPFVTEYSVEYLKNISEINNLTYNLVHKKDWKGLIEQKHEMLTYANKHTLSDNIKKKFGYRINETILRCTFNLVNCNLNTDFDWIYNADYGNCFRFNTLKKDLKLKSVSRIGKHYGLSLDLFVGYNKTLYNSIFGEGAHIFLNNQTDKLNDGIDISVGFQTNIGVNRLFVKKKEEPYSDCKRVNSSKSESIFVKKLIETGEAYRQADCFDFCVKEYIFEKCNCNHSESNHPDELIDCHTKEELDCFSKISKNMNQSFLEDGNCIKECPIECDSVQYQMTISQIDYPTEELADLMKQDPIIRGKFNHSIPLTYKDLKKSLASLNIYYDELGYKIIKELPAQYLLSLVSNIGGIIGLFLGISFVSVFEIFELFLLIAKKVYDELINKKQVIAARKQQFT